MALSVVALKLSDNGGMAVLSDNQLVQITNFYDEAGDECGRDGDFTWFVCGPSLEGYWFTEQLEDFTWKKALDS